MKQLLKGTFHLGGGREKIKREEFLLDFQPNPPLRLMAAALMPFKNVFKNIDSPTTK